MNFDFSEEQNMLRDSVAKYVQDDYDWDTRKAIAATDEAMKAENWQTFAELGWLSVPFAEEFGGFGGGPVDVMVMMEELGKGLVLEPYFATVVLFGGLLHKGSNDALKESVIPSVIEGSCLGAFAYLERQSRFELNDVLTTVTTDGEDRIINGEKVVVLNGGSASHLIVSARSSGAQSDAEGISLYLVPADADGVEKTTYRLMDGQVVANIRFNNVKVPASNAVCVEGEAAALIQSVTEDAMLALGAEALGVMGQLNSKTVEYTKTREQFGVKISSFQALQHRMVETFMAYEQTKSLLYRAVCDFEADKPEKRESLLALKIMIDKAGKRIYSEAIQMHGGMGITDELDIGHYAKRLMMIGTTLGDAMHHMSEFTQLRYAS
jgi:alkylation response protein AidB-like acyl-CoA dehydrogenase